MIYLLIILASAAFLSFMIYSGCKTDSSNEFLLNAATFAFFYALVFLFSHAETLFWGKNIYFFCIVNAKLLLLAESLFYLNISFYLASILISTENRIFKIVQTVLIVLTVAILIYKVDFSDNLLYGFGFENFIFTQQVNSRSVKVEFISSFYKIVLIAISSVLMILGSLRNALKFQKAVINIVAVFFLYFSEELIVFVCQKENPYFFVFMVPAYICGFLILLRSDQLSAIYKLRLLFIDIVAFLLRFTLPSILCAAAYFPFCWMYRASPFAALVFYSVYTLVIVTLARWGNDKFRLKTSAFAKRYKDELESELSVLDYHQKPELITNHLFEIIRKYVTAKSLSIGVCDDANSIKTVYSTDKNLEFAENDMILFNALVDFREDVVVKSDIGTNAKLESLEGRLSYFFRKMKARALLVLHEGASVTGVFCLGEKGNGQRYNSYDKKTFKDLYSYFFVCCYFLQNVMNKGVVGIFDREIKFSSQIIQSIQENMDFPAKSDIDFAYQITPAREIGGEFVDMIEIPNKRHIFIVGSLSGKGVSASMNMVVLKNFIRTALPKCRDLKVIAQTINEFIIENLPKETFFSAVLMVVDFKTKILSYVNCGIPAVFFYSTKIDNVIDIQGKGCVLGVIKDIDKRISIKEQSLSKGDIILTCTSGLMDSQSLRGERFGRNRIRHCMADRSGYNANQVLRHVFNQLKNFASGELSNDITALVLER